MHLEQRRGQGLVEYILMSALVAGMVLGIFPVFSQRISAVISAIQGQMGSVVAQTPLGTPFNWFFNDQADGSLANGLSSLDRLSGNAGGAGGAGANAGSAGANGNGTKNNANGNGSDAGKNNQDSKSVASNGASGSRPNGFNSRGGRGSGSDGADANTGDGEENGDEAKKGGRAGRRNSSGSDSGSGLSRSSNGGRNTADSSAKPDAAKEPEKKDGEGGPAVNRLKNNARPDDGESQGCQNIDFFTLLKILAVIAVLVIGGVVALTSKGNDK